MSNHVINRRKSLHGTNGPVAPFKGCTTRTGAAGSLYAYYLGACVAQYNWAEGTWEVFG